MIKLKEIYKVGITTNASDLPDIIQRQIYIGGPGFIVGRLESFSWGDYVVIDEDNRVHGMTKKQVSNILHNASVIAGVDWTEMPS